MRKLNYQLQIYWLGDEGEEIIKEICFHYLVLTFIVVKACLWELSNNCLATNDNCKGRRRGNYDFYFGNEIVMRVYLRLSNIYSSMWRETKCSPVKSSQPKSTHKVLLYGLQNIVLLHNLRGGNRVIIKFCIL